MINIKPPTNKVSNLNNKTGVKYNNNDRSTPHSLPNPDDIVNQEAKS
jgi:hypothetical protein